jgi:hypothetical protein
MYLQNPHGITTQKVIIINILRFFSLNVSKLPSFEKKPGTAQ